MAGLPESVAKIVWAMWDHRLGKGLIILRSSRHCERSEAIQSG